MIGFVSLELQFFTMWKSRSSSGSRSRNFVYDIRGRVILFFENRSLHKHRPKKFYFEYLNIASKRAQRENLLRPCKAVFSLWKSSFCVRSPPCCCRKTFVIQHRPKRWCEKNVTMWTYFSFLKTPKFVNIALKRWCQKMLRSQKCYHVNVFSSLENR